MTNDLEILAQHSNALLLAEAAAWLHDYRKCSDEQLKGSGLARTSLETKFPSLSSLKIPVDRLDECFIDLLKWDDNGTRNQFSQLGHYLVRCHHSSHFDKQEPVGGQQSYPDIRLSTPFGFEKTLPGNLTSKLWDLPWNDLSAYTPATRVRLQQATSALFSQTVADTRRPINEVDLWGWGVLVGALYKAALAGALLTGQTPKPDELHWRLLGVRFNGPDYLLGVVRIPDLLARQELLTNALSRVRVLLEVTYPLGAEVYRDENGSIFVVSNLPDLLKIENGNGASIKDLILNEFAQGAVKNNARLQIGGEIIPQLELEVRPWWGQDPAWPNASDDEPPGIGGFLSRTILSPANPSKITSFWTSGRATEICTVCGLRPQGPNSKAAERKVCDVCEARRADRSKAWATEQSNTTIWTDEVADVNGRLALIVGHFDLTHWFDESLLKTLLLIAPNDPENTRGLPNTSKTPSFGRLRRIWETTRQFWERVQEDALRDLTDDRRRLKVYLDADSNLGPFHVYELGLGTTVLSMVWTPGQNPSDGYLLSADNLGYIAHQLNAEPDVVNSPAAAAIFVEDYLRQQLVNGDQQPVLRNPDARAGRDRSNLSVSQHTARVEYQDGSYSTTIPILAEPRTFMALVPANMALNVVKAIQTKYEREMGKVRNRLPLTLGIVYAGRRTPLASLLDAGRRMLRRPAKSVQARVETVSPVDPWPQEVTLTLKVGERMITVAVPTVMGDGTTQDLWYPYWQVAGKPTGRDRWFVGPDGEHWVHVRDLRACDTVAFTPSTFDFEYLDASARRFEVAYNGDGQRLGVDKQQRPYLLEQIGDLEHAWSQISRLPTSQIKSMEALIEAKRRYWDERTGTLDVSPAFKRFVGDVLREAKVHSPSSEQAAVSGMLADALEIHLTIHKDKLQQEDV